jgi:uncharacterized membrane protein
LFSVEHPAGLKAVDTPAGLVMLGPVPVASNYRLGVMPRLSPASASSLLRLIQT